MKKWNYFITAPEPCIMYSTAKIIVLSQKETVLWNSAIGSGSSGSSLTKAPRESGRSSPSSSSSLSSIFGSTLMSLYDRFWPTKRICKWKYQLFAHDISCAFSYQSTIHDEIIFLTQRRSWRQDDCGPRWEQCRVCPWPLTRRQSSPDLAWPRVINQETLDTPLLGFRHDGHSIVCTRLHWRSQFSRGC